MFSGVYKDFLILRLGDKGATRIQKELLNEAREFVPALPRK